MEETKVQTDKGPEEPKVTLQDCINAYAAWSKSREEQELKEAEERKLLMEDATWNAFAKVGLVPYGVSGSHAYFDMGGLKVTFVVVRWKYGQFGFYRILDEICPNCEMHYATDEMPLDIEFVGASLASPQKRYHDCPNWEQPVQPVEVKSANQKLLEALDEYIAEKQIRAEI